MNRNMTRALLKRIIPCWGEIKLHALWILALSLSLLSPVVTHAKPPPHNIAAANLQVIQLDTGNTVNSVLVTAPLSINDMRVRPGSNRGDYNIQIGDSVADDARGGVTMVSISQNGRDNGELADEQKDYSAPAFDGGAGGIYASINNLQSDRGELNINCSIAYFRTNDWLCGWFRNTNAVNGGSNTLYTGSPDMIVASSSVTAVGSYNFKWVKNGEFRVSLFNKGIDSRTNPGVLLVTHAKNEGNYCSAATNADGTWEIYVKDNFANATSLEQDPCAFVFIPRTNTTIVSGKFGLDATGTNAVTLVYSGSAPGFAVTNLDRGRYRLTIPGGSPDGGVLMVSSEGGKTLNFDNTVSYERDGNGWIIEHRDVGSFPPPLEACTNEPVCSFVYIPAATPGLTISPTNTLITSEYGLTATFNVQLDLAPTNDVFINLSSSNPSEGIVTPSSLTFNSLNWNIPQSVIITGQDDALQDGPVGYSVVMAAITSDDLRYNGFKPDDVSVINVDDESYGVTITPTSGLITTEAGGSAQFSVFLNRAPTADVTLGLSSDAVAEGLPDVGTLTFNSTNWNVPQIVTVNGVDDARKDGNKAYKIITAAIISEDANYNGVKPSDISLVNIDNDNPAINYTSPNPLTVIEGSSTNYTVVLATQPDSNVVITVTSGSGIGTVAPATLTFTPANWNEPQVVTVFGTDNFIADGNVVFSITNTVASTDPLYADFNGAKVISATRLDNETSVTLPSGDCIYGIGMPAVGIDGRATITDSDVLSFNNGTVTFTITTNNTPDDVLAIRNDGVDISQIGLSDTNVTYGGLEIGSFVGGTNGTPLVISLNANATLTAVQQLIRSTTFQTTTNNPSRSTRSLVLALNDGLGVTVVTGKSIRVGALRLMQFQEGADHGYGEYHGAADTMLTQYAPGTIPTATADLLIDWPDGGTPNEAQVLLRFDGFSGTNHWQVPSNAVVVSADLLVNVNNTGDGGRFYRMLVPWDAATDTWDTFGEGVQQDDVESRSTYESQLGVEDGSGATGTGIITVGVTPDVQAWVGGATNCGWVMKGWTLMTDGTAFSPSEAKHVAVRPRLRVLWLDQGFSTASFRQGVNGYTNTADTSLRQAGADTNYVTDLTLFSDEHDAAGTNTSQVLLRFDNIIGGGTNQIPPGSIIHAAILELASVGGNCMGQGGRFYLMLQPWTDTTATWNTFSTNGVVPDGIIAAAEPSFVAGSSRLTPLVQGTINSFEVTGDLQAWASGARQNYGWAVLPWLNGTDGWGFRSSKFSSVAAGYAPEQERPRLRVYYTTGVIAVAARIKPLSVGSSQVSLQFTGSAGFTYHIWRAARLGGAWTDLGAVTVDGSGNGTFDDAAPLNSGAVYSVVWQ